MTTKLDAPIRREVVINGEPHTVVISSAGVIITKKRARAGYEYTWRSLADPTLRDTASNNDEHDLAAAEAKRPKLS